MHSNNLINFLYGLITKYPSPVNLTYFWNFGIFSFFALIIQIITGILLVMHYTPNVDLAFSSVEHIMRDIDLGWLLRYIHANGASLFFIVLYLHISRSLLYGSYVSRGFLWSSGVIIFLLTIITAFLGHILPWGQMSLRGATVITNPASAIPVIGNTIVIYLWGGFSVDNPTSNRFFSLHYLMPFLILLLVLAHLFLLHVSGSNNPIGTNYRIDGAQFGPYYIVKDIFSLSPLLIFFFFLVFFVPNALGHPDNYIMANSDVTPAHIVPEWYSSIFYGILRSILSKGLGIIVMLFSILVFFVLIFQYKYIRIVFFQKLSYIITVIFISVIISLAYIGGKSIESPFFATGQMLTFAFFALFFAFFISDKVEFNFYSKHKNSLKTIDTLMWSWFEAAQKVAKESAKFIKNNGSSIYTGASDSTKKWFERKRIEKQNKAESAKQNHKLKEQERLDEQNLSEKDIIPGQKEETSITERSTTGTTGKKPPVNESSIFTENTSYGRYLDSSEPLSMNLKLIL